MQRRHPRHERTRHERKPRARARWRVARRTAKLYGLVALGTAAGGTLRGLVSLTIATSGGFPWPTLIVNVAGSFVIALYAALTGPDGRLLSSTRQRHFVMTGFCGGLTTFSVFSVETLRLMQSGRAAMAAFIVALSAVAWLAAAWAGHAYGQSLNRPGGR